GGHQPRHHGQRGRRRGDRIRLAGHRPAPLRRHRIPRFPRRAGHRLAGRRDDHRGQPLGRSSLRRDRPADPIPVSTASAPLSPSASPSRAASLTLAWRFAAFHVGGLPAVLFVGAVGTALGILSGFLGGWVDQVIMRVTDTWLALPALTFAIFLAAVVGPSEMNIVIILGAVYWTRYARVIRGEVL